MLVNEQGGASQGNSEILHPGSRQLFRFWEATRGSNSAPLRSQIDLKKIRELVPQLAILDRAPGGSGFRWRLAGTGVCEIYRRELTGRPVLEGWDVFERDIIERFLNSAAEQLQPCVLRFRFHTDMNQLIGTEFLGLPIQAANGGVHIFGGLFAFRDIYGLGHSAMTAMELSGARSIWTEHLPGDRLVRQLAAETPARAFRPFQVIRGGRG